MKIATTSLPVDHTIVQEFARHVAEAGLVIWNIEDGYPYFDVGLKPDESGHFVCTRIDPSWAYGDPETSFEFLASKLKREAGK
jgi:hypothetical protein